MKLALALRKVTTYLCLGGYLGKMFLGITSAVHSGLELVGDYKDGKWSFSFRDEL